MTGTSRAKPAVLAATMIPPGSRVTDLHLDSLIFAARDSVAIGDSPFCESG
jgi:hypothetical protein